MTSTRGIRVTEYWVDSSAWIEYLEGSSQGQKVREALARHVCYTPATVLAETASRSVRKGFPASLAIEAITVKSQVIPLDSKTAQRTGLIHAQKRRKSPDFSLVDASLLAHQSTGQRILTKNHHLSDERGIEWIGD